MKFLVDAHLPRHLSLQLIDLGYDSVHTLDLPNGNRTSDKQINEVSENQQRVVITKDADFVDSFLIAKKPYKLLLVSTGNISNRELKALFVKNLPAMISALQEYDYVELTRTTLIEHS
jgi:predicted nuclease of predicted toxin-antitoxin system